MKRKTGKRNFENPDAACGAIAARIEQKWFSSARAEPPDCLRHRSRFSRHVLRCGRDCPAPPAAAGTSGAAAIGDSRRGRTMRWAPPGSPGRAAIRAAPARPQADRPRRGGDGRGKRKTDTETTQGQRMLHSRSRDAGSIADQTAAAILCRQHVASAFTPCPLLRPWHFSRLSQRLACARTFFGAVPP